MVKLKKKIVFSMSSRMPTMLMSYWSENTWLSNIKDVHYKLTWNMAVKLFDVVVPVRPRVIPLAMITMRKSIHGFLFLSYMGMVLRQSSFF